VYLSITLNVIDETHPNIVVRNLNL